MRISDWSSDVCSSDLWPGHCAAVPEAHVPDRTLADTAVAADEQHVVEAPAPRLAGQVELGECPDVLDVRQRALVHEAGRAHRFWRRFARRGQSHYHVTVSGRQRLRGLRGALELPRADCNARRAVAAAGDRWEEHTC